MTSKAPITKQWWKEAVVYQIYPSSFKDSTGNGTGDLNGIRSKLEYLEALQVDMLWLCPIYDSPDVDKGYDIRSYQKIDEQYGTMEDWQALLDDLHSRGMKLIMDLVINHTSDLHDWFLDSRSSKTSSKRSWYIWRPAKYSASGERQEPNNWKSIFGGSAWQWDEETEEYYLHIFAKEQPDINWDNGDVRKAIRTEITDFWLKKGIDGFRLDAINFISKPPGLPDAPITEPGEKYQHAFSEYNHGPRIHEYLVELHRESLNKYDVLTVGESAMTTPEKAMDYISQDREDKQLQMIFNTDHLDLYGGFDLGVPRPKDLARFKNVLQLWQNHMQDKGGHNAIYLENHDHPRSIGRFCSEDPEYRFVSAKALAIVMCTLGGTMYIYQGQELGMINLPESASIEEYKDLVTQAHYQEQLHQMTVSQTDGTEPDMSGVMAGIRRQARDNARTPMPWDATEKAGFTTGTPWMMVNPDNKTGKCNVADQLGEQGSVLEFWRSIIKVRKDAEVLNYGHFTLLNLPSFESTLFGYTRSTSTSTTSPSEPPVTYLALVNLSPGTHDVDFASTDLKGKSGEVIIGNYADVKPGDGFGREGKVVLRPYEGMVVDLK